MMILRPFWYVPAALFLSSQAFAATVTVTSTDDTVTANDGKVTLREAITAINAGNDLLDLDIASQTPTLLNPFGTNDTINFNIAGAGVQAITLASNLPNINKPVFINGYSQPGASQNTNPLNAGINAVLQIEIAGMPSGYGLDVLAAGTTIRGLAIHANRAIVVSASNVTIAGNFIGTNAAGTTPLPGLLGAYGVQVSSYLTPANNVVIGGANNADRNLIVPGGAAPGTYGIGVQLPFLAPGPGTGYVIQGNYVGTDVTGTLALSQGEGLDALTEARVEGNLISGNPGGAIKLLDHDEVLGNLVGTQRDGTSPLPNGNFGGIEIHGGRSDIGDSIQPNVIAYNTGYGLVIYNGTTQGSSNVNTQNGINANSIYSNGRLGISLNYSPFVLANDSGDVDTWAANNVGNNGQNYPVITVATVSGGSATVSGTLNSVASFAFTLEFFANAVCDASGYGQGQTYLGTASVTTDASGNGSFGPLSFAVPAGQLGITSTATTGVGDTSEFSKCFVATSASGSTTTALASSLNPSMFGQAVTFTATVTGNAPTGTVQFKDGAANFGAPVTLSSAIATLTTSTLSDGTHPISAVYSGDANNATSTSPLLNQIVNVVTPAIAPTTTALISSLNPAPVGQSVTFTATVSGAQQPDSVGRRAAQDASPRLSSITTGTVIFSDGANALGNVALGSGGAATFTTSSLSVGAHPITATYSGDANYSGSSANLSEVITDLALPASSVPAPTLGAWATMMLILIIGVLAGVRVRRRHTKF